MQSIFNKSSKRAVKGGRVTISEPRGVVQQGGSGSQLARITNGDSGLGEFGLRVRAAETALTDSPLSPSPSHTSQPPVIPPKYSFSPTYIPHRTSSDNSIDSTRYSDPDLFGLKPYGFLGGVGAKVVLGLEDVRRVVSDVARELEGRGLATPMLFSNQALELGQGQARGKLLILAYVDMLSSDGRSTSKTQSFSHDLQYAKENELAWFLRWALSRISRKKEGTSEVCHGVMEWEIYEEWRGRERAANYPADAFPYLASLLPSAAYMLLQPLFHLLSRLAAHSHLSGLTPHALSSLFAPLLFNVPVSSPALVSHTAFVRAAAATEHLLLAYIRSTSRHADLGLNDLPLRLKEWVTGYPAMVVSDNDLVKGLPRKGARVVRCERATRIVRAYSKDLVATAETWAEKDDWPAWERVVLRSKKGVSRPKFTGAYRRRMIVRETPSLPSAAEAAGPTEYGLAEFGAASKKVMQGERRHSDEEEARYGSLAGKEWSMFEEGGFGAEGSGFGDKLRFDLTETAKLSISERRQTMNWNDFAAPSGGFTRTDPALTTTLSFAAPLTTSIEQWPKERSDLSKRLHKSQKDAVPFHHDTTIRFGADSGWDGEGEVSRDSKGRVYLEEAFVDFWADLGLGGGWVERAELTFRESSWAIMEYKARPSNEVESHPRDDPRTSTLYFLFEEKVPYDYQYAIANPQEKRAFSMFSRKKKPSTLPIGPSLTAPEGEFDRMLLNRGTTKKVTLNGHKGHEASIWHKHTEGPVSPTKGRTKETKGVGFVVKSRPAAAEVAGGAGGGGGQADEERSSFFSRSRSRRGRAASNGAHAEKVDFELQSASGAGSPAGGAGSGEKEEDKWMDVLVANGARRMDRQDAEPPRPRSNPRPLPTPPRSTTSLHGSHTPSPQPSPERPPPQIYHSPDASAETEDDLQTPRMSSLSHHAAGQVQLGPALDAVSPIDPDSPPVPVLKRAIPNLLTRKPLPLPSHEVQYVEGDQGRDSWSSASDRTGVLAPSPRRGTDTIYNIVDTYRDSATESELDDTGRFSRVTETDDMYASEEGGEDRRYSSEREGTRYSGDGTESVEELASPTKSVGGDLEPPKPVFDLTPTREPSPGRYRHGEALHFVREEPEEERYR